MNPARTWLEYAAARAALGFLGALPRDRAIGIAMQSSRRIFRLLPRLHRVGQRNLELALPDASVAERELILERSMENFGRIIGEFAHLGHTTPEELAARVDFRFSPVERARYREAKAAGRGVLFVTPHLGNWEILALAVSALLEPVTYLARPLDNPLLERAAAKRRSRFGNRPINKRDSVMEGLQILDRGGNLGLIADVNTLQRDGVFVPFFGIPACTTRAVAMLALRTNALIIPICGVWIEAERRYAALTGKFVEVVRGGNRKQSIMATTALYTAELERFIRAYPEQWIWVHRRWKTRPTGDPDLYAGI